MTSRIAWHRVFHPLCGADPLTLARLIARSGPPSWRGAAPLGIAAATSLVRLPFTLAEAAWSAVERAPVPPPVFIVGFPRSGTTHLHNLIAASGRFATVPPVLAGLPWEARGLGAALRPFIEPYLPATRIIDAVKLDPDSPTEDEVALANMCDLSYFHAIYFPRRFRADYLRGFLYDGASAAEVAGRARALRRYVAAMSRRDRTGPLLLKNPAYTSQVGWIRSLFPEARIVHIHRDPRAVFASNRRILEIVLRELALQSPNAVDTAEAVLEAYPLVMDRLLQESREAPPDRFAHVAFEALVAAPEATLRALWARLDLPEVEASVEAIRRYLKTVERYRTHGGTLEGPDLAIVRRRWSRYFDHFGAEPVR